MITVTVGEKLLSPSRSFEPLSLLAGEGVSTPGVVQGFRFDEVEFLIPDEHGAHRMVINLLI